MRMTARWPGTRRGTTRSRSRAWTSCLRGSKPAAARPTASPRRRRQRPTTEDTKNTEVTEDGSDLGTAEATTLSSTDHANDALFEEQDIEVQQKSQSLPGEPEVGQELGLVQYRERGRGLQFDNNQVFDEKVHSQRMLDADSGIFQ